MRLDPGVLRRDANAGIIYIGTVVTVLVLFVLMAFAMGNIISVNAQKTGDHYAITEAELLAHGGIEYAFLKLGQDFNWTGTSGEITLGKGSFNVAVYSTNEQGGSLDTDQRRIISTGTLDRAIGKIQVMFKTTAGSNGTDDLFPFDQFPFIVYIKESDDDDEVEFEGNMIFLEGDMFIGADVEMDMERENITFSTIYVPAGYEVDSDDDFDDDYNWQIYPDPVPVRPNYDYAEYDLLLDIADDITETSGNRIFVDDDDNNGNLEITSSWNITDYADNTVFINAKKLTLKDDAIIPSATFNNPAYIVVYGEVKLEDDAWVGDNIIIIAKKKIHVHGRNIYYGLDVSAVPFEDRPARKNKLFSKDKIDIHDYANIFADIATLKDCDLKGNLWGTAYVKNRIKIEKAYVEGSIVAGAAKEDKIKESSLKYSLSPSASSSGVPQISIMAGTWKVF